MKLIASAIHLRSETEKIEVWKLPDHHSVPLVVNGAMIKGSVIDPTVAEWCTENLKHFKLVATNGVYELHATEEDMFLAKLKLI